MADDNKYITLIYQFLYFHISGIPGNAVNNSTMIKDYLL